MKLLKNGVGMGLAVGLGAAVVVPLAAKLLSGGAKPLLKEIVKGGLIAGEAGRVWMAEAKETLEDITAEARDELNKKDSPSPAPQEKADGE